MELHVLIRIFLFSMLAPYGKAELCRIMGIADAGHNANADNPKAFNEVVEDFLDEL